MRFLRCSKMINISFAELTALVFYGAQIVIRPFKEHKIEKKTWQIDFK